MLKYFKLYNLIIESNLDFPELQPSLNQTADIIIKEVPFLKIEKKIVQKEGSYFGGEITYQIFNDDIVLVIQEVGEFYIDSLNSIHFTRFEAVDDSTLRSYLLGTCLGFLLIKKGIFSLHASAVQTKFGIIVFIGESGYGKSTIAGKFLNAGHKILTDDICVVEIKKNNTIHAFPSLQRIKFWDDSAEALGYQAENLLPIMPGWEKRQLLIPEESIVNNQEKILAIYELSPMANEELRVEDLIGMAKLNAIMNNIYKVEGVEALDRKKELFMFCSKIAQIVPVKRIIRPLEKFRLDEMYETILNDLN